jgi:glycerophosphoryl diester phosphodiesterase
LNCENEEIGLTCLNTYNNIFGTEDIGTRRKETNHHGVIICGHRGGAKCKCPENTIRAFEHGIREGLQGLELDVSNNTIS